MDENSFIPTLEQMTDPPVPFVEELGIYAVQLPHTERKVSVRRFNEKVKVIGHETISVANPVVTLVDVLKGVKEVITILIVLKYRLLLVTTGSDVINGTWIFDAKGAGHARY